MVFWWSKIKFLQKHSYIETKNLIYLNYNSKILKKSIYYYNLRGIEKLFDYIIGYQSIQKRDLFLKLIYKNKFGFFKKNLPFSLEKNKRFKSWLPYKIGVVKEFLFQ